MNREQPLLQTRALTKSFLHKGVKVRALDKADIFAFPGRTAALVGESGCGKTTFAKTVMGLHKPDSGEVIYRGTVLAGKKQESVLRRNVRIVFQDPFMSVDPRFTVFSTLYEALNVYEKAGKDKALSLFREVLDSVELSADILTRYPHQVSGGQLQRVCIARSLLSDPEMIILDEPTASLDVTTAAKIMTLLKKLQKKTGIAYLFISHNLKQVRHISDYIFVMYRGQVVEWGAMREVYDKPAHPYTRLLLEAVSYRLKELPSPASGDQAEGQGCVFGPRCSEKQDACQGVLPVKTVGDQHWVRCYFA